MPREPLLPESTTAVRPHSPDASAGSERKRRRKVLSCYDCRRRKLQCDRAMPACGRCTKSGNAANCLYIDDPTEAAPSRHADAAAAYATPESNRPTLDTIYGHPPKPPAPAPAGDRLSRLEYQDRRIRELEAALAQTNHPQAQQVRTTRLPLTPEPITVGVDTSKESNISDRETMLLRGKSFKTQFHGISYPGSLIAYIPELSTFTKETFEKFPALFRIRQELKALEDRTEYAGMKPQLTTGADLKEMLPSRAETDHLVQLYLDNYDCVYHIIHLPSFQQEYNKMWSDIQEARPHFVAIVLLMTAAARCLSDTEPTLYTGNSSANREKALFTLRPCEDWLQTQSQKHVTIADFQIRFLIMFVRMVNGSKFKRTWTEAGNVLRFCMAAGLHRNPDLLRKPTSALDKEMRKRVWTAVSEFELQMSFWRGMISSPWPQQSDSIPPISIHDDDIGEISEQLPHPKPASEFTRSSYLAAANETFMLRYTINSALNNIRQTISFDDAKAFTDEIERHLQALPNWTGSNAETPRALLSITLRQYMLVLHDRQVRQAASPSERNFSRMILIDTATRIISTHKSLVDNGHRGLQFVCNDQIRAALSVVYVATTPDPQADGILGQLMDQTAAQIINDAIELITDKILRLGREQRQVWITLAANGFMKAKKDPSRKLECMQEAIDKVSRIYYKIMAFQEDAPTATTSDPPTGRSEMPNGLLEFLPDVETSKGPNGVPATNDPTLLDFDAIAAWTFDDWTFNAGDFPAFDDPYQVQP